MKYRNLGVCGFASLAFLGSSPAVSENRPNVLFIMTDQQRWDALGCAGNHEVKTPNIDRLAREGVMFQNAYSACPVCVPARSAILTGRTIINVNVLGNNDVNSTEVPQFQTFDKVLSENGYRTEYYGKWHAPYQFASHYDNEVKTTGKTLGYDGPTRVDGFRKYLEELGVPARAPKDQELIDKTSLRAYIPLPIDGQYEKRGVVPLSEGGRRKKAENSEDPVLGQGSSFGAMQVPKDASLAAYEGSEALTALRKFDVDKPFSLTCSFGPPHPPFIVPADYASLYDPAVMTVPESISDNLENAPYLHSNKPYDARFRNPEMIQQMKSVYYAMVTQVDEWVGKLLDELDKKGISDNTIVIFVSDHGEMMGDHGMNGKVKMYEGSAHIPFIIRYPKAIAAGKKVSVPVSHHDIFATILDYTGMPIPQNDGRSLRNLVEEKKDPVNYAVSIWGDLKNGGPFMIRQGDWKLIVYMPVAGKKQVLPNALYDLKSDPLEMNNLIGKNPQKDQYLKVATGLQQNLKAWMVRTGTPFVKDLDQVVL